MFYSAVFSCCGNKVPVYELNTYKEGLTGCGMSLFSLPRCGMEGNLKRDVGLQWGRGRREVDYFLGRMWELLIFRAGNGTQDGNFSVLYIPNDSKNRHLSRDHGLTDVGAESRWVAT